MFGLMERLSELKKIHKSTNLKRRCKMDAISNVLKCVEKKIFASNLHYVGRKTKFLMRLGIPSIFLLKVGYLS